MVKVKVQLKAIEEGRHPRGIQERELSESGPRRDGRSPRWHRVSWEEWAGTPEGCRGIYMEMCSTLWDK